MDNKCDKVADAIDRNFTSPNVSDSNFEAANITDTTNRIANSIYFLSKAILICFCPDGLSLPKRYFDTCNINIIESFKGKIHNEET